VAESTAAQVFVIPPPTTNGPLHVGHLSGPYLGADVAARAARERGESVLALGGVDVHQNYVLTCAEDRGVDVEELVAEYRHRIDDAYDLARIRCDARVDPQDSANQTAVAHYLADFVAEGTLDLREATLHACADCGRTLHHSYVVGTCRRCGEAANGGSCEGCGAFTSAEDLLEPRCNRCGGAPVSFVATVPILSLEAMRERLTEVWLAAELGPRVRDLVSGYLSTGLPDVPVAYPTNWGTCATGALTGLRVDVYADVALSTFHTVARALDPAVTGLAEARRSWRRVERLWHFNGIDNAFCFAILFPALYLAAGATPAQLAGTVVNEFFTLDGLKFSTSRDHAIWVDELLRADGDADALRLFLAWARPGADRTDFSRQAYDAFRAWARPLLDGSAPGTSDFPPLLVEAEVARGERALQPRGFDSSLAVRCLLNVSAAGAAEHAGRLRRALTGVDVPAGAR
jgi:methionyl-tRNA synthetase